MALRGGRMKISRKSAISWFLPFWRQKTSFGSEQEIPSSCQWEMNRNQTALLLSFQTPGLLFYSCNHFWTLCPKVCEGRKQLMKFIPDNPGSYNDFTSTQGLVAKRMLVLQWKIKLTRNEVACFHGLKLQTISSLRWYKKIKTKIKPEFPSAILDTYETFYVESEKHIKMLQF